MGCAVEIQEVNRPKADIHPTPKQFSLPAKRFIEARYFDLKFWYKILWFCTVSHFFTTPPRGTQLSKTVSSPSPWFTVENCGRLAEAGTALALGRGLYGSTALDFFIFFIFSKALEDGLRPQKHVFSFPKLQNYQIKTFFEILFFQNFSLFSMSNHMKNFVETFFQKKVSEISESC